MMRMLVCVLSLDFFAGCKLLYKQDFTKRLGLKCVTCNYCFQMCRRGAMKEFDGKIRDFCSEECSKKFHDWYYKVILGGT